MPSRALVTGGGRGIGADIARELAAAGWHVTVTGRTGDQVEQVANEIGGTAVVGDVSKREDVERMVATAGPIDLLVANAGIAVWEGSWETDPDEWWHVFEVNVRGVYLTCRFALPGMIERGGGRIVITGSGASYLPGSTSSAYSASKAAVGRYGEVLAQQVEPHGVKVFVISPGLVNTEMTGDQFPDGAPWTPPELATTGYPPEDLLLRPGFVRAAERSLGATCTRSTTRPTSSRHVSSASSRRTSTRSGCAASRLSVVSTLSLFVAALGAIQVWRARASSSPSSASRAVPA
ncbi:MAG: SDR family NAD(P)-dependent oxidoreductase [Actinobacteria bacterium]|nr:SDR family NAD(P)-dependent oxidoreductase [Actinomycetota bacterium]